MTGLLNQKSFRNYIDCKENEEKKCTIIIMDVNDFKLINDEYGHEAGNDVLIEVSRILKDTYKDYGKCYRIGGDEFAVIVQTEIEKIQELNDFFLKNLEKAREKQEIPRINGIIRFRTRIKRLTQKCMKTKNNLKLKGPYYKNVNNKKHRNNTCAFCVHNYLQENKNNI